MTPRTALGLAVVLLSACATTRPCENWSAWCGCFCGPGRTWSGAGPPPEFVPPLPVIATVNGRVLHPTTGQPVDCDLMGPYESRIAEVATTSPWKDDYVNWTNEAIGGMTGKLFGLSRAQVHQGIAISRACRAAP